MRITQEADYALRIAYLLACKGSVVDSKTISDAVYVPERFAVKILRKLVLGGVVRSHKGSSGGYELAVIPKEISMHRIVEVIDGPLEISRCLDSSYSCSHNGMNKGCCVFHLVFDKLNRSIMQKLDAITLDLIIDEKVSIEDILAEI